MRQKNMRIVALQTSETKQASLGESTLSALHSFHRFLGLKEHQMMAVTKATYKLATRYTNWDLRGCIEPTAGNSTHSSTDFYHSFSAYGSMIDAIAFQHHLTKFQTIGQEFDLSCFSLPAMLAKAGKFMKPQQGLNTPPYSYAMHIDSQAYTKGMQDYAKRLGVTFVDSQVEAIQLQHLAIPTKETKAMIHSLKLESGDAIEADFFIDCSDDGVLINQSACARYVNWSDVLPCDRFISVKKSRTQASNPYTTMGLHECGYTRCFPLQDEDIEEFYYSSSHLSDDKALDLLGKDAIVNRQKIGCRPSFWSSNCIAMGKAAGNLDRLAASNFHLVQSAILRLIDLFPDNSLLLKGDNASRDEYNSLTLEEYQRIQDYHVAHFAIPAKLAEQQNSVFWQDYKRVNLPDSLEHKLALFKHCGRIPFYERETFSNDMWVSLFLGLGWRAQSYDVLLDMPPANLANSQAAINTIAQTIQNLCSQAPIHQQYLDKNCTRSR